MKKKETKIKIRIPRQLFARMQDDLRRPHEFAWERVGFAYADTIRLQDGTLLVLFKEYLPVQDGHYLHDGKVGARIGSPAIQEAMQHIIDTGRGGFHVHLHDHHGPTGPSGTDKKGIPPIAESLANANGRQAHGLLILSKDSVFAEVKLNTSEQLLLPNSTAVIKYPLSLGFPTANISRNNPIFNRQSFLGADSERLLANVHIGIVGLGGGGSHLVQQLAYLGVRHFTLFDFDHLTVSNHNRLIGGYFADIEQETPKIDIAVRMIRNICPDTVIRIARSRWEDDAQALQACDIAFGGVDTYQSRSQLEAECRRYLIPYIDIGMDLYEGQAGHQMSGQVILSLPGAPCMRCFGFLTEANLAKEAAKYGDTSGRPQVVWPNGLLASSAVGIFTDLLTGWSGSKDRVVYLAYDGNTGQVCDHIRLKYAPKVCSHYPLAQAGKPKFIKL